MTDLLNCPFCGAEPEYSPPSELSNLPFIACPAVVRTPEGFEEECGLTSQSVTHWNRRAALIREAEARGRMAGIEDVIEAMQHKVAMWNEDDDLNDWVKPGKTLISEAAALRGEKEPK